MRKLYSQGRDAGNQSPATQRRCYVRFLKNNPNFYWGRLLKRTGEYVAAFLIGIATNAFGATFELSLSSHTQSISATDGRPSDIVEGSTSAHSQSQGQESSMCQPYGRMSSSASRASVNQDAISEDNAKITLSAAVSTRGGHYRTCGECLLKQCLFIEGHDTGAQARALADSTLSVRFGAETLPGQYRLSLVESRSTNAENTSVLVKGPDGKAIQRDAVGGYILDGKPGATYQLSVSLSLAAENKGFCCNDDKNATVVVNVDVDRLAQIGQNSVPFILNGKFTNEYKQVGLITLQEKDGTVLPHCTGTLIARKTVLTAAHCVAGDFAKDVTEKRLRFIIGSSIDDANAERLAIDSVLIPNSDGFAYQLVDDGNGKVTTIDDIAVAYLASASATKPLLLYQGIAPSIQELLDGHEPVAFVGFGVYSIDADGSGGEGAGKKRLAWIQLLSQDQKTFGYNTNSERQGTCRGDSGGPALVETPSDKYRVLGVTAYGAVNCGSGRSMRVDKYLPWIKKQLRD